MTLELRIVSGTRAGVRERFDKPVISVGRHPLSDLRFDPQRDLDVSTRHAELREADGVWTVHDQQSTNGTFVNGSRVEGQRVLCQGDQIAFGANGPRVEVRLDVASGVSPMTPLPSPAAVPASSASSRPDARKDTTVRIAEAVAAQTRPLKRALYTGAGIAAAAAVLGAVVWQRQAAARERELVGLIARSDSTSAALERTVAEMRPRDSAFAALLAERAESGRRARRELGSGGTAPTAGQIALYSSRVAADARAHESLLRMDFAAVHDRNDRAIAMVASDLDGTFIAGTAFGVTADGLLVTNRHVMRAPSGQPARRVRVIFANTSSWLDARIVRLDEESDLALIQVTTPGRYPTVAGVSRTGALARAGAPVASIGFPHATDTPMEGSGVNVTARSTIAAGTVSKTLSDVTQVDSYAGRGSSGSPLFDAKANVVGVIFGGAPESAGRIVYAVPAARLAAFVAAHAPGSLRN